MHFELWFIFDQLSIDAFCSDSSIAYFSLHNNFLKVQNIYIINNKWAFEGGARHMIEY